MGKERKTRMTDDRRKARNTRKQASRAQRGKARPPLAERNRIDAEIREKRLAANTFAQPEFKAPQADANADAVVATLLMESFAAHKRALTLRLQKDFFHGDEQLTLARDKRREAHRLDPEHTAPAWVEDAAEWRVYPAEDVHKELLAFYDRRLDPPKETE